MARIRWWLAPALAGTIALAACDGGPPAASVATTTTPVAPTAAIAAATTPAPAPAPATALAIAEARGQPLGTTMNVSGVVTAGPRLFDPRGRKFYLQDKSGGVAVFFAGGDLKVVEGDAVTAKGTLSAFNSELEIVLAAPDDARVTGHGAAPSPTIVHTGDVTAVRYGTLVTVQGGVSARQGTGFWLDDGSGGIQGIAIPAGLGPLPNAGDAVTVTGITARSKGTLQIQPRRQGDIVITGRWADPEAHPPPAPRPASVRPEAAALLLAAVYPHTYEDRSGEGAEAVRVQNIGATPIDLGGWQLTDNAAVAVFPPGVRLAPGARLWVTADRARFQIEFGEPADLQYGSGGAPADGQMLGDRLTLPNTGGEVALLDPDGAVADAFVYGVGHTEQPGWTGPAAQPYLFDTFVPPAGQVFQRKLDQRTGRPLPNTHNARDWMQDAGDPVDGRRLLYAGWSLDRFFFPATATEDATTRFLLGPDNLYEATAALIDTAQRSIDIEAYTFSNPLLLQHILARQAAGVAVRALFDGGVFNSPDGSYDEDRWTAQQIVRAGGAAWFWTDDPDARVPARFNNHHQKFLIVDGRRVLITSENFEQSSMPADPKTNGTAGNRGAGVITDAPGVVQRLQQVFAFDADPARPDIRPVALDRTYRAPADQGDKSGYGVVQPSPLTITGPLTYEVVQSPESSLRTVDSLIGMVARAGAGDMVLVQQQYEYALWSGGLANPRLEAYIDAARRGATVLLLLDAVNDAGENQRTIDLLRDLARREGLRIEGRMGKPAGGPIHNKMVLATAGAAGYVHISSINGSENASVFNREIGLQVRSIDAYRYFAAVFAADWRAAGGTLSVDTRAPAPPAVQISPTVTRGPITITTAADAEYFIDADPGMGRGTPISGRATAATDGLSEGMHAAYVRVRDGGVWGAVTAAPFTVARTPPELIVGFDPNAHRATLTPAGPFSATASVSPPDLQPGTHEYTVADGAGNALSARITLDVAPGRVRIAILAVRAGDGAEQAVPDGTLAITFEGADAGLTRLSSEARAADGTATSRYDATTNRTTLGGTSRPGPRALALRLSADGVGLVK